MPKKLLIPLILIAFVASYAIKVTWFPVQAPSGTVNVSATPKRIVSMAPSITETLYALGLGDRVVGVTRFCDYPPEAAETTRVGGFLDPNFEVILRLEPDLVILLPVHGETKNRLEELSVPTLDVDHRTLAGILDSITAIGKACGAAEDANALLEDIDGRIQSIASKTKGLERPSVLLSAGRSLGTGKVEEVYVAGKNQWYDDVIQIAGGKNAYTNEGVQFPSLSGEGLLRLNPDVIIEMAPELKEQSYTKEDIVAEWNVLDEMKAVKTDRIHVLTGGHVTVPGPRVVRVIEDVARVLHPGLDFASP